MKELLRHILEQHQGRENAITRRELRQTLNLSESQDRMLRLVISEIRHDKIDGLPVMFSTSEPSGYYLPATLKEVEDGKREWKAKIVDECITLASLKKYGARFVQKEQQGVLV